MCRPGTASSKVVVAAGLEDPQHVALDAEGNLFVSDRGNSHQVKVFDPAGKPIRRHRHSRRSKGRAVRSAAHEQSQRVDYRRQRAFVGGRDRFPTEAGQRLDARRPPGPRLLRPLGIRRRRQARSRRQDAILLTMAWSSSLDWQRGVDKLRAGLLPSRPRRNRRARWASASAASRKRRYTWRRPGMRTATSRIVTTAIRPTAPA